MTTEKALGIKNVIFLPIKWVTERYRPCILHETTADSAQLRADLEAALLERLRLTLGDNGEILRTYFTAEENGGAVTMTLRAECLERIDTE